MRTRKVATYQQAIALKKLYGGKIKAYQEFNSYGYTMTMYEVIFLA